MVVIFIIPSPKLFSTSTNWIQLFIRVVQTCECVFKTQYDLLQHKNQVFLLGSGVEELGFGDGERFCFMKGQGSQVSHTEHESYAFQQC